MDTFLSNAVEKWPEEREINGRSIQRQNEVYPQNHYHCIKLDICAVCLNRSTVDLTKITGTLTRIRGTDT